MKKNFLADVIVFFFMALFVYTGVAKLAGVNHLDAVRALEKAWRSEHQVILPQAESKP